MDIKVFFEPVFHIIIKNIFSKEENTDILNEVSKNKKKLYPSSTAKGLKSDWRTNISVSYDELYNNNRHNSSLLTSLSNVFKDTKIAQILNSSPFPLNMFSTTNFHETEVSRYGDNNQHYNWHVDKLNSNRRIISFIYYFNNIPQKYTGGELQFTNSPIFDGKPIIEKPNIRTIIPENNMGIFFGSGTPHAVLPTNSSTVFKNGRFSVNCWIGIA